MLAGVNKLAFACDTYYLRANNAPSWG